MQFAFETGLFFVPTDLQLDPEPDDQKSGDNDGRDCDGRIATLCEATPMVKSVRPKHRSPFIDPR